ncbi:hypothetical protein ACTG9Q_13260 [Actinokineospora sp. 24-640]
MSGVPTVSRVTGDVRALAGRGVLAEVAGAAEGEELKRLRAAVYGIAYPVVFKLLTRRLEFKRGHAACASSIQRMEADCLDRFHDDTEAVVEEVLRNAKVPIRNMEAWIGTRLTAATVNGYRRRRGERGALQRPRVSKWLGRELQEDPVLLDLAVEVLDFVGGDVTVGPEGWPVDRWVARRMAADGGDPDAVLRAVRVNLARVLAAMRTKPAWYESYVERPMGFKRLTAIPLPRLSVESSEDTLAVGTGQWDDPNAWMLERASIAVDRIEAGIAAGGDPGAVVVEVVRALFAEGTGSEHLHETPHHPDAADRAAHALADAEVVRAVLAAITT